MGHVSHPHSGTTPAIDPLLLANQCCARRGDRRTRLVREHQGAGAPITYASDRIVLDDYFHAADRARIDFLKVDTDGADYDVLRGADQILRFGRVLGVAVEAQFHGTVSTNANLFSNIDLFLRDRGFSLFDLEIRRLQPRPALPSTFALELPAETVTGQVSWGDAIYFRDFGDPCYESTWGFEPTRVDLFKLICLYEIFGLMDCSAELVLKYRESAGDGPARSMFLDVLTAEQTGGAARMRPCRAGSRGRRSGVSRRTEGRTRRVVTSGRRT